MAGIRKKLIIIMAAGLCMILTAGCGGGGSDGENTAAAVTAEEETKYRELIESTFNDFYWNYDEETLEFYRTDVPRSEDILAASDDAGFNLRRYSGREAVCASVNLNFYNGSSAGKGYMFFSGSKVAGVYYKSENGNYYSLNNRNVFTAFADFKAFETDTPVREFDETIINYLSDGFSSEGSDGYGNFMTAHIDSEGKADIITIRGTAVTSAPLSYGENTVVVDCAVAQSALNRIAVLAGERTEIDDGEGSYVSVSEKIELYNKSLESVGEISDGGRDCSFVGFDGEYTVAAGNGFIDYYQGTEKVKSVHISHSVTDIKKCDLDGDGTVEYVITDGLDIYVYHIDDVTATLLWRTNISTKYFDSNIYTGDLNGDGVSEIYISDISGCGIRYTLTEKGFKYDTLGEGGEIYYTGDFNGDGKTDYIKSAGYGSQSTLCIAK